MRLTWQVLSIAILLSIVLYSFKEREPLVSFEQSLMKSAGKFKVGDIVRSTSWENESYWEGEVVQVLKDVVYQVRIRSVRVNMGIKLYLNPTECSGKKRLSYEDGDGYNETKIWVHERCLD